MGAIAAFAPQEGYFLHVLLVASPWPLAVELFE